MARGRPPADTAPLKVRLPAPLIEEVLGSIDRDAYGAQSARVEELLRLGLAAEHAGKGGA